MKRLYCRIIKAIKLALQKIKIVLLKRLYRRRVKIFCASLLHARAMSLIEAEHNALQLRQLVRSMSGISVGMPDELVEEFRFLHATSEILRPAFQALVNRRVLFCGQSYYNTWYLSRALRALGWKSDVYNWDANPLNQIYYHGEDFMLGKNVGKTLESSLDFYLNSIYSYDVIHFCNANGISYGEPIEAVLKDEFGEFASIHLLRALGKKIVYSNNGCLDGVSQTAFAKWGPDSACAICRWENEPTVCSDEKNLLWGRFRNSVSDFQCLLGGNRVDYNDDPRVHEVPEFYCLDSKLWDPDLEIPEKYQLPSIGGGVIRLYHAVGHRAERTLNDGKNIKSSHVYLPLIDKLRQEGMHIQLIEPTGIPNMEVRFLQMQADIFLDMLSFGWFGANAREAMMLSKPVICFIRPEWLESLRKEIPAYAEELPVINATPKTVEAVLRDLIASPKKRLEIGRRSREFAIKWHSSDAGGRRFDQIYSALLSGDSLLRTNG